MDSKNVKAKSSAVLPGMLSWLALAFGFLAFSAQALPQKVQMLKPRAFYQETENNLLEALDLKERTFYFGKAEFDQCGLNLVRQALTLSYSCTLPLPVKSRISKLHTAKEDLRRDLVFGSTQRQVQIKISEDAKQITFSTKFDATGIDFEVTKFNDDFFGIYAKVAQQVIAEALKQSPVSIKILESR